MHSVVDEAFAEPRVREIKYAVEIVVTLSYPRQIFGLEPFDVRQVAKAGEPERLQEFPRRDIGERRAGLRGADRAVDQAVALEAAMTSRLISRPASFEISPLVTGCR